MKLHEIMSTEVTTIAATADAAAARTVMREHGFHHLVVVQEDKIVGIVSDRDLGGAKGGGVPDATSVAQLMSAEIVTAGPNTAVKEAAAKMRGQVVGCLPVVDHGQLVGIVTIADLLELLMQGVKVKEKRDRRGKKKYIGPLPGAPHV